jgi:hypothetical protein
MKGQHNRILGHPHLYQLAGHSGLCSILLNPELILTNIHVQHTRIDSMQILPADQEHLLMIALHVEECLHFHVRTHWIALRMACQQLLHIGPIGL